VALEERCAGVQKGLGSAGTLSKVYVQGTDNAAMLSSMTAKLTQDKSIDAVITLAAPVALVALQAMNSAHSTAKLYTFDTNAALISKIKSGAVQWAVDQQPYLQGYLAVDSLWLYLTNGNVLGGGQAVLTGPSFVDASNVAKVAQYAEAGNR
jgi:simple sugar transport system substrate-binding protein